MTWFGRISNCPHGGHRGEGPRRLQLLDSCVYHQHTPGGGGPQEAPLMERAAQSQSTWTSWSPTATFEEGLYSSSHLCHRRWNDNGFISTCPSVHLRVNQAMDHSKCQPYWTPLIEPTGPPCWRLCFSGVTNRFQAVRHEQRVTSLQGTETKTKIPFNSSVVNYSLCIRLKWIEQIRRLSGSKDEVGSGREGRSVWDRDRVEKSILGSGLEDLSSRRQ